MAPDSKSICLQCGRPGSDPWVGKIPGRRKWQPIPIFLPGESHGQRSLGGCSPWGHKESDMTERLQSLTQRNNMYLRTSLVHFISTVIMISFNLEITKECPLISFIIYFFPARDPYFISMIMTVCKKNHQILELWHDMDEHRYTRWMKS